MQTNLSQIKSNVLRPLTKRYMDLYWSPTQWFVEPGLLTADRYVSLKCLVAPACAAR